MKKGAANETTDAPQRIDPRPAFARDFPREATLDALVDAFENGDFARIRIEAPALASSTEDDAIKRAALLLRARIDPDPLARGLLVLTAVLLVVLSAWWITHDGSPGTSGAPVKAGTNRSAPLPSEH